MSNSNRESLGRTLVLPLRLVAFAAVLLFLLQAGEAQAGGTFNPSSVITLSDYNACAPANVTSVFTVPAGDMNFQVNVTFTPEEWYVASAADVPIGAIVGQLNSESTLSLLGTPCFQKLYPAFTMYNGTVDTSDELARAAPGPPDYNQPQDSAAWDVSPANGILDGADHYPVWLKDATLLGSLQPIARYIGVDAVHAPPNKIVLQFVVFAPGTCPPNAVCPAGYPSMTVLQDPTTVAPGSIGDFCTPLKSTNVTYGLSVDNPATGANEAGYVVRRNPIEAGTHTFRTYVRSYNNADDDPYENYLDTCPLAVNIDNPTLTNGTDGDGLDPVCDPLPDENTNLGDHDGDGYFNRQDNCPTVDNGLAEDNQADPDLDMIGTACDPHPDTADGGYLDTTEEATVDIVEVADCDGDGMPNTYELAHTCLDPLVDDADADADDDGASNIDEMDAETDPCVAGGGAGGTPTATASATATATVIVAAETTLAEDASAGDTEIIVEDATGFAEGDTIEIGTGDTKETNTISAIDDGTITLADPLEFDHAAGEAVVKVIPLIATPTSTAEVETCAPVFPGTYSGLVRIDGQPAASGYEVTASVGDLEWGSAIVSGGRYAMDIPNYMPSEPPCFEGGAITFTLNGMVCSPSPDWASGLHTVDLSCAPAASPTVPPPTEVPATPTTAPATPVKTPTVAPPSGGGGLLGSGPGLPLWTVALAGWAGLTIVAGLGTLVAVKRG